MNYRMNFCLLKRTDLQQSQNSIALLDWLGSECQSQHVQPLLHLWTSFHFIHDAWVSYVVSSLVNDTFSPPFGLQRCQAGGSLQKQHRFIVCPSRHVQRHFGHRQEYLCQFSCSFHWLLVIQALGEKNMVFLMIHINLFYPWKFLLENPHNSP